MPVAAPPKALGVHVQDSLRRMIVTGGIAVGTHLVEAQLSEAYDVSRGPVRDALRQLEAEGLVASRRRGVFVVGLTEDDIEELYSLRQLVEQKAVALCLQPGERDWSSSRAALALMRRAADAGDPALFAEADLAFHDTFYDVAGHRRLAAVWQQHRPVFADMLAVTNTSTRDLQPVYDDHVDLLAAVVERRDDALPIVEEHIDGARRRMLAADRTASAGAPV
ncbi:GntR family transcriptional regulator [uncultured Pseudokineococcus sp.]|uniref:GntR family transcriptional regulator n=1 Tax=uncultured Pseudokineococcus sp. TaxID=1642928 RepID=UPI002631AEC8|nr:GntR family transcriptional regulator [uncultured Pseudokineococcus sp.]